MTTFRKVITFLLLAVCFLAGCTAHNQTTNIDQLAQLSISSNKVSLHDTITLTLPAKHPSKLSFRDPNNVWHLIHDSDEQVMLPNFATSTSVEIAVSKVTGVSWVDGKRIEGFVFTTPGEYLIYLADNLETEPENTFSLSKRIIFEN